MQGRLARLAALGNRLKRAAQEREVGREAEVVVESRQRGGWKRGLTDTYHTVMFRGPAGGVGALARLRITALSGGELRGVPA